MMRAAVRDATILTGGFESVIQGCIGLGVSAVEVALDRSMLTTPAEGSSPDERVPVGTPLALANYKEEWTGKQIAPVAFLLANRFGPGDNRDEIDWCIRAVESAEALGMKVIRLDSIMALDAGTPAIERAKIYAGCVEQILVRTAGTSVALAVENHGPHGNDPTFLRALLGAVDTPRFGLTLDTGNLYWYGNPLSEIYPLVEEFAPRVYHTHIKNIKYPPEMQERRREPGWEYGKYVSPSCEGDIDLKRVAIALLEGGYDEYLCMEDESLPRFEESYRRFNLRRNMAYLQLLPYTEFLFAE